MFHPPLYYGPEFASGVVPNFVYPNMFYNGLPRQGSPPWRPDDKDGHYVFVVGDTLTPRCESLCYRVFRHLYLFPRLLMEVNFVTLFVRADQILSKMGEGSLSVAYMFVYPTLFWGLVILSSVGLYYGRYIWTSTGML